MKAQFLKEYDRVHKSKEDIDNKFEIASADMQSTQKNMRIPREYKKLEIQLEEMIN